jgi:type IV secretion system protein VirB5
MFQRLNLPRKYATALCAVAVLTLPATAHAIGGFGDIVFDPTSYAQIVKEVQSWEQQYQQMQQALTKAEATVQQTKAHLDAVTGNRGFGDLLNNPLLKSIVPTDLASTLSSLNSTGNLTGNAASIRNATMIYNCGDVTDNAAKIACQALLGQNAQAQAVQQNTMALLNQRTTQIEALRAEIADTQDPKAIAELEARLQAEEAQVGNDQNKIALTNAMLAVNQASAAQAEQERVNALMATNKTSALDGFSFTGLGYQPAVQTAAAEQ